MRRPTSLLLFVAIFVSELGWGGISPLLPTYQDRYGLTDVATGLILTLASLGILLVCLPAGGLSNRFAVRSLTLWSLAALTIGNLVVGLSDSYGGLLAGRIVFGVGLGTMWVTGTAWLHEAAGEDGPRALALTTSIVGGANLIGPGIIGWLADRFTIGTPFVLVSCLTGCILVVLVVAPSPEGRTVGSDPPLREMLRAARTDHLMLTSVVITIAVALMWMSAELLVPLRLDEHGYDASEIGLVFSISSGIFLVASALTSARAERYATVHIAAVWTAVFAAAILTAAVGTGTVVTLIFLAAMSVTTGVLISLTYPLGAAGAARGRFNVAVVGVLLTLVWAGSGLLGPTAGAVASEQIGDRSWFAGLAVLGLGAAAWMWLRRDSASRRATAAIPRSTDPPRGLSSAGEMVDVLVVGGGSAGCVVAARLAEHATRSVMLLEAGPDLRASTPARLRDGWTIAQGPDWGFDWGFQSEGDGSSETENLRRGKLLGGTSWLTRFALRGSPADHDEWAALGNTGWGFDDVLPSFRRLETDAEFGGEPWHGDAGPIPVTRYPGVESSEIAAAIVRAVPPGSRWSMTTTDPAPSASRGRASPCGRDAPRLGPGTPRACDPARGREGGRGATDRGRDPR